MSAQEPEIICSTGLCEGAQSVPESERTPRVYIIAGPNGAGKTTFAQRFLPDYVGCLEFVNADMIASGLSPFSPETVAFRAGRLMLERIRSLGASSRDFGFETTLSGKTYARILRALKDRGYHVHLFFLWIRSVELALERIADRVRRGGHDVPEQIVRRRFDRGLLNFSILYRPLLDSWVIFDNSGDAPFKIASEEAGILRIVEPNLFAILSKDLEIS